MSTAVMPPPSSPPRSNEDLVSWAILVGAFVLSITTHVATVINLPEQLALTGRNKYVEMELYQPPPPPPKVEEPKPEPPKPDPPKAKPPPVKVAEVKPPPEQAPPPPNQEPPPETDAKPVPLVVGISLSSTTEGGSFAVNTGNTTYGKADSTPTNPADVKAYRAPKYVPPGGADTQPEVANEFKPPYPDDAKKNEIEGTVVLKVTIDEDGKVTDVKVLKGLGYGLDEASIAAMRRFKFKPATKGGEAVGTTITYNYSWYLE
ncbi:MAG: energy transducer TonB [Myxococcaceae bacterium]|nr:energy transducer TonB [Myxococcaceae bacterium]